MSVDEQTILREAVVIISDLFGVDAAALSFETTRASIPEWDSLQHMNLVLDVERHFQIRLAEEQIASILCVRDLVNAIQTAASSR